MPNEQAGVRDEVQAAVGSNAPMVGNEQTAGAAGDDGETVKGPADDRLIEVSGREIDQYDPGIGQIKGPHPDQWPNG